MEQHTAVLSVIAILEFAEMNFVNVSGSIDPTLLVWRGNSSHWISYETGTHLKSLSKQIHWSMGGSGTPAVAHHLGM